MRCKVPELEEVRGTDLKVQDSEMKQKSKNCAYMRRNAKENGIQVGDKVLIQQPKSNKLTTRFEAEPYRVVGRCGSQATTESSAGVRYKRNISLIKRYQEPPVGPAKASEVGTPVPTPNIEGATGSMVSRSTPGPGISAVPCDVNVTP